MPRTMIEPLLDPDLLRAARRRRPKVVTKTPELHEEWAAVQGFPAYAFYVDWPEPYALAILQLRLIRKTRRAYAVQVSKTLFQTPDYRLHRWTEKTSVLPRSALSFTRREAMRRLIDHLQHHNLKLAFETRRMSLLMADIQTTLTALGEASQFVNDYGLIPPNVLERIPVNKAALRKL